MRTLICFTLLTASSIAFERPESLDMPKATEGHDQSAKLPVEKSSSANIPSVPAPAPRNIADDTHKVTPSAEPSTEQSGLPWLGVLGDPVSDVVKAQLGIDGGLVLRYIAPESPAEKAGLKVYDIIQTLNGQPVQNQTSLKQLISVLSPKDCVKLGVHSQGKQGLMEIDLCHKPKRGIHNPPQFQQSDLAEINEFLQGASEMLSPNNKGFPREENAGVGRMFGKLLKEMAPNLNFESTSSISVRDSAGSVEIQTINSDKNVIVRDAQNKVQFQGPWNTEEDFAKATPEIRERINRIGSRSNRYKSEISGKEIR